MYNFFGFIFRLKYIKRWSLMRNTRGENVMEHTASTVFIAHALALIANKVYGKSVDISRVVLTAQYHETGEVITGDLPTPIKYFNKDIKKAYKNIESLAADRLLDMLPESLKAEYAPLVKPDAASYEFLLVKAADKICAYIKCLEELSCGNKEFSQAGKNIERELGKIKSEEVRYFLDNFIGAYSLSLDKLNIK
jgi:5'-deoxynucleotidase